MAQEASLQQIRAYFNMTAGELMREWKVLDEATKTWYKEQVALALIAETEGV